MAACRICLAEVAQRYVDGGHYDTVEQAREGLRYSVPDSPLAVDFYDLADTGAVGAFVDSLGREPDAGSVVGAIISAPA